MGQISKTDRPPLFPLRHEQGDFFVCDLFDAIPKGDHASMEHPVFTVSQKPDLTVRRYESNDNTRWMEITPSVKGLATVFDRDIIIYATSQLIAAINAKQPISKKIRLRAHDFLLATNRQTNGNAYEALKDALERLAGTRITTNITTNDVEIFDGFGLIENFRVVRQTRQGRMQEIEITLSDWIFNAIEGKGVLTYSPIYFQIRGRLERRLYEIARKKCGTDPVWECGLDKLQNMTGSKSHKDEFRRMIQKITDKDREHNHIPDYRFTLEPVANGKGEKLVVRSTRSFRDTYSDETTIDHVNIYLKSDTYDEVRKVAPRYDPHFLEREWREWIKETPKNPDAAFIGFCRSYYERHGEA